VNGVERGEASPRNISAYRTDRPAQHGLIGFDVDVCVLLAAGPRQRVAVQLSGWVRRPAMRAADAVLRPAAVPQRRHVHRARRRKLPLRMRARIYGLRLRRRRRRVRLAAVPQR